MVKNYNPKTSEVLGEMKGSYKKSLKEFGDFALGVGGIMIALTHAIPTGARKLKEAKDTPPKEYALAQNIGGVIGATTGLVGQVAFYVYAGINNHSEAFFIPAATNVLSGIYEFGKHSYRNAKKRTTEKHGKELSDILN